MVFFHASPPLRDDYDEDALCPGPDGPAKTAQRIIAAYEPGSKLLVLGMVIQPLMGILIMGI